MNIGKGEMKQQHREIKCVVWDLDDTIWKGTLLEDKDVYLKPGIRDILQALDSVGILNSIASRNPFRDAWDKLKTLELEKYFLYPEICWDAKSVSIERICRNLNISMDTLLFIDDQPFERAEVQDAHPEIMCLDAKAYGTLLNLPELKPRFVTVDSKHRRQMYQDDIIRKNDEESHEIPGEKFLSSLCMKLIISKAKEDDLKRVEELTMRTNQLNATGRIYSYDELNHFRISDNYHLLVCELTDRYGSYGKIGIALIEQGKNYDYLKLLLMSCRVMNRGVGTVLLSYIMNRTRERGKKLRAEFRHTGRNRMMYISFKFSDFKVIESDGNTNVLLENDLTKIQPYPSHISVIMDNIEVTN